MSWYDPSETEDDEAQFAEFVQAEQSKAREQPKPEPIVFGLGDLVEFEPPPFDDPKYRARCESVWREDHKREIDQDRARWLEIIGSCIAGNYGRNVRDDWQSDYSGVNPETLGDTALMQAAQAVWVLKGSRCVEKMPQRKVWQ